MNCCYICGIGMKITDIAGIIFGFEIIMSPISWYGSLNNDEKDMVHTNVFPVLLMIAAALSFGIFLRIMIIRRLGYKNDIERCLFVARMALFRLFY